MKFYKTLLAVLLLLGLSIFVGCDNSTESSNPTAAAAEQSTVYTVRFNPNGGTGMMVDLTADKGDSITLSANTFVKTGYTFTHWNDAVDGSGTVYADKAAISDASADIVLFAQWKPNHYVITLSNDGDVKGDLTLDAVYDSVLPNLSALPSKKGYDFRGYFTESDGHGKKFIDKEGKAAAEKWTVDDDNPLLYAFFIEHGSHTIEYRNTKNALNPNQTAFKEADSVVLSDIAVVGYTFIGWFDASTDGSLITGWNAGDKDDNVTLWARWAPNIICFSDGTFGSAVAAGKTPVGIAIVTDSDGIPLKIMNLKQSDKSLVWAKYGSDGYYGKEFNTSLDDGFDNWAVICKDVTDEDVPGSYPAFEYASSLGGGWYMPAKNELNAIYQCKDEINTALQLLKDAGFDADLIDDVDGNRPWYQSSSADGENYRWVQLFSDGEQRATLRVDGYVRTVRYFHSYKVIFDPNGGTGDMADLTVDIVEPAVLPDCEFTREYHSFVGWNDRADGTGNAYTAGQTVSGIGADGEAVTLYAQWRPYNTVAFNANGGNGVMSDLKAKDGTSVALPANTFTRTGYTFSHWNDADNDSGTVYADGSVISNVNSDITLYAQWTINNFTVTFITNGGEAIPSQTVCYGENAEEPTAPTKANATFFGWFTSADGGDTLSDSMFDFSIGITSTTILYAKWVGVYQFHEAITTVDETHVHFGDFPQTIKAADVMVNEEMIKEMGEFTYYLGSDGCWYAKCAENANTVSDRPYSDGSVPGTGSVTAKYFKVEPIKWVILTNDYNSTGKKLLHAANALTARRFGDVSNGMSEIDSWLNDVDSGFLGSAFTENAQNLIAVTEVSNEAITAVPDGYLTSDVPDEYGLWGRYSAKRNYLANPNAIANGNTQNKIFILSVQEVTTIAYGFSYDFETMYEGYTDVCKNRLRKATDWAIANYIYCSFLKESVWWLRSPYKDIMNPHEMYCVSSRSGFEIRTATTDTSVGVVPALCVDAQ